MIFDLSRRPRVFRDRQDLLVVAMLSSGQRHRIVQALGSLRATIIGCGFQSCLGAELANVLTEGDWGAVLIRIPQAEPLPGPCQITIWSSVGQLVLPILRGE